MHASACIILIWTISSIVANMEFNKIHFIKGIKDRWKPFAANITEVPQQTRSNIECGTHCVMDKYCDSFAYCKKEKRCQKYCKNDNVPFALAEKEGWIYFQKDNTPGRCTPENVPKTCQEWKDTGYTENGDYMVDPDGPGGINRFQVECEMDSHQGVPVMIMHHDSETMMNAGPYKLADLYANVRNVTYQASIPQIITLINALSQCKQYIKYDCIHTAISNTATWYSRDGTPMYYWGGAQPGSGKCACGMTKSCDKPGSVCNCDTDDSQWRSDSGMLTDKNTLPVTKMAFGDLNSRVEEGYHTLGPLRCY